MNETIQEMGQEYNRLSDTFSYSIGFYRNLCGYSHSDVAEKLGISVDSVVSWETGEKIPSYYELEGLAYRVFKIPLAVLFFPKTAHSEEFVFKRVVTVNDLRIDLDFVLAEASKHKVRIDLDFENSLVLLPIDDFLRLLENNT